jgi:hypothetical protein
MLRGHTLLIIYMGACLQRMEYRIKLGIVL